MKNKLRHAAAAAVLALSGPAAADIIYSGVQNIVIPTGTWTGATVNVNGGTLNPFFGGVGVANDALFQPARSGTDQLAPLVNLSVGTTISYSNGALQFSTGAGGSEDHMGTAPTQFAAGAEGYIGFNANGDYGWMRVVLTNDTGGGLVEDWAYDSAGSGGSITVGRVNQSVVSGGAQAFTLSPQGSEAFTLGSVISDTGGNVNSVVKTGSGTTSLKGTNSYTGVTTISAGTLMLGNASALGTTAGGTSITSGAVLDLNGQPIGGEAVTLNGTGISGGGALINSSATPASLSGTLTLASASSLGGSGNMTLSGAISGAYGLTKVGGGTVSLSGSTNGSTTTTVSSGTLQIGDGGTRGVLGSAAVTDNATLAFNRSDNYGGTLSNTIGGTGALTLQAGTLTLSGTNTYSGSTTVSAGTLVVNGNQSAATGAVSVTGTLAGTGTLGGATIIQSGGTLAPGALGAVGKLNFSSSLNFAAGSIFEWELNENQIGTAFDMVGAGAAVSVDTHSTVFKIIFGPAVNMSDAFWSQSWVTHDWALASIFGQAITGTFASVVVDGSVNPLGSFSIRGDYLVYTTIPEPTSALTGLLLVAGVLRRKRRCVLRQ